MYVRKPLPLKSLYSPFGAALPTRVYASTDYRFGFNGKENDNEVKGDGNSYDFGARIHDPRLGRWLSLDPLTKKYPELTPYQFASNRPIDGIDQDGLEYATFTILVKNGKTQSISVTTDYELKNDGTKGPVFNTIINTLMKRETLRKPKLSL